MKKLALVFTLVIGFVVTTFAQTASTGSWNVVEQDVDLKEGQNSIRMSDGSIVRCMYRGTEISNIVVQDKTGKRIVLDDDSTQNNGNPGIPTCSGPGKVLRCVYDKTNMTVVCFCLPTNLSAGGSNPVPQTREHVLLARQVGVPH